MNSQLKSTDASMQRTVDKTTMTSQKKSRLKRALALPMKRKGGVTLPMQQGPVPLGGGNS